MEERPTQSRKGVKGGTSSLFVCPLQGQGTASLVGFGATPQLFRVKPTQRKKSTKAQAAKRPCPKLCASSDAPPSCSFDQLCCVAPNGRDRTAWLPVIAGLFRKQGISPLRARVGGNENRRMSAVALWKPSAPPLLGLIHLDDNRSVSWRKPNCPPSAPQSFPHAAAPDSQTAPPAPGTAARRPSAPQTG